jgi:hypothetical protein
MPFSPFATKLNATIDPNMLCIELTGMPKEVAISNHIVQPAKADTHPISSCNESSSYSEMSIIGFCIISETLKPRTKEFLYDMTDDWKLKVPNRTAPDISKKPANILACLCVKTPEPILVPNELAASFVPILNERRNAIAWPARKNQQILIKHPSIFFFDSLTQKSWPTNKAKKKSRCIFLKQKIYKCLSPKFWFWILCVKCKEENISLP